MNNLLLFTVIQMTNEDALLFNVGNKKFISLKFFFLCTKNNTIMKKKEEGRKGRSRTNCRKMEATKSYKTI